MRTNNLYGYYKLAYVLNVIIFLDYLEEVDFIQKKCETMLYFLLSMISKVLLKLKLIDVWVFSNLKNSTWACL